MTRAKIIYGFSSKSDKTHNGLIKIGMTSLNLTLEEVLQKEVTLLSVDGQEQNTTEFVLDDSFLSGDNGKSLRDNYVLTSDSIIDAANKRRKQICNTSGLESKLEFAVLAFSLNEETEKLSGYNDAEVHKVLEKAGINKNNFNGDNTAKEWFKCTKQEALKAIMVCQSGVPRRIRENNNKITLRTEQQEASNFIKQKFKDSSKKNKSNSVLLGCVMRFGKTFVSLKSVQDLKNDFTLVITHLPSVHDGWAQDTIALGMDETHAFLSKKQGNLNYKDFLKQRKNNKKIIAFASIQDLRGSFDENDQLIKNAWLFNNVQWDCLFIDEAHEGTQTGLAEKTLKKIKSKFTINISGTSEKLQEDYKTEDTYLFSYEDMIDMRNKYAKTPEYVNTYSGIPDMEIRTIKISDHYKEQNPGDLYFNGLADFFSTSNYQFNNNKYVDDFLSMITQEHNNGMPYSQEMLNKTKHSLWYFSGVQACKTMETKLKSHPFFKHYQIINVAGGDVKNPLKNVRETINNNDATITLTCDRLTTGVTVPEWSTILFLSDLTAYSSYRQAMFRVMSPGEFADGTKKDTGYIFDFAPNRALKIFQETVNNRKKQKSKSFEEEIPTINDIEKTLESIKLLTVEGNTTRPINATEVFNVGRRVSTQEAALSGKISRDCFNLQAIKNIENKKTIQQFNAIFNKTKDGKNKNKVILNQETINSIKKSVKNSQTKNTENGDQGSKKESKPAKDDYEKFIENLQDLVGRIYTIAYTNPGKIKNIEDIPGMIDDEAWESLMGLPKELWETICVFIDDSYIQQIIKHVDDISEKLEGIKDPAEKVRWKLFFSSTFQNPGKETVITPVHVVNQQIVETVGGIALFFSNENGTTVVKDTYGQEYTFKQAFEQGLFLGNCETVSETKIWNREQELKCFDINVKTGAYIAMMVLNRYQAIVKNNNHPINQKFNHNREDIFNYVITNEVSGNAENVHYKNIAQKILTKNLKITNISLIKLFKSGIIKSMTSEQQGKIAKALFNNKTTTDKQKELYNCLLEDSNKKEVNNLIEQEQEFPYDLVLSNPPYQVEANGNATGGQSIYHHFINMGLGLSRYVSMVTPSRWLQGGSGKGIKEFREKQLASSKYVVFKDYSDSMKLFPTVDIQGGISFFLIDNNKTEESMEYFIDNTKSKRKNISGSQKIMVRDNVGYAISEKVKTIFSISEIVSSRGCHTHLSNPNIEKMIREEKPGKHSTRIFYASVGSNGISNGLINIEGHKSADTYRVAISTTSHTKNNKRTRADRLFLFEPGEIFSRTFNSIGQFKTRKESLNCLKYIKSDFANYLLSLCTPTQDLTKDNYTLVPMVDFKTGEIMDKPGVFIDFDKDIDEQLFSIYGLTDKEQKHIQDNIRPFKDKNCPEADKGDNFKEVLFEK